MAQLKFATLEVPSSGIYQKPSPGRSPTRTAPLVKNFLVHTPGKLVSRDGCREAGVETQSVTGNEKNIITNVWSFNNKFLVGFHTYQASGTGYVPPWKAPYLKPAAAELAKSGKKLAFLDMDAETATEIKIEETFKAPGSNGQRLGKYVYGFAYWSSETEEVNGGYQGKRPLLRWDGTATAPTILSNAPQGGQAVKAHLNRLWVLGGRNAAKPLEWKKVTYKPESVKGDATHYYLGITDEKSGGLAQLELDFPIGATVKGTKIKGETSKVLGWGSASSGSHYVWVEGELEEAKAEAEIETKSATPTIEPSALYWTDEFGPIHDTAEEWKDDNSGLYNELIVGDDDQNDFGVTLAVVNNALIIFKRHSIWALYGYSTSTFAVRNLTKERGLVDPNALLEMDSGVYFVSQNGLEFFDGSQFNLLSEPVSPIFQSRTARFAGEEAQQVTNKEHFGRISLANMGNNYIMVNFAAQNPTSTSNGADSGAQLALYVHTLTGNWGQFEIQEAVLEGAKKIEQVGTSTIAPWIWDGKHINPVKAIFDDAVGEPRDNLHGTERIAPLKVVFDRLELSAPGYKSQAHRIFLDYTFGATKGATAFYVKGYDGAGSEVIPKQTLTATDPLRPDPLEGNNPTATYKWGKRWVYDDFNEVTDLQFVVEREDSGSPVEAAEVELFDGGIEYQTTSQRRSL
jgi:hypothetical protein